MSAARPAPITTDSSASSVDILARLNRAAVRQNPARATSTTNPLHDVTQYALKPLYSEPEIHDYLNKMAIQMNQCAAFRTGNVPLFLTVQIGAAMSAPYVLTKLDFDVEIDNIQTARYHGTTVGGALQVRLKPATSLKNRPIIIYDDIIDLAVTAGGIIQYLINQGADPALIYLAVMLDKDRPRDEDFNIHPDFCAMKIANQFIVGYGLDYTEGVGRNLNFLGVLVGKDEEVAKLKQAAPVSYKDSIGSRYMLLRPHVTAPAPVVAPTNTRSTVHSCG
jgi:hypoxanthine phosphoribosyltransferase